MAYRGTRDFPDWYRPYLLNYNGHGYLLFTFAFFCLSIKAIYNI